MGPNCLQEYSRELTNYCLPLFDLTVCRLAGEEWLLTGEQQDEYYPEIGVVSYYITCIFIITQPLNIVVLVFRKKRSLTSYELPARQTASICP